MLQYCHNLPVSSLMLWFYRRDRASLSLETRYDNETSEYVAVVVHPDGRRDTERFDRREAFAAWLHAFEKQLDDERWAPDGPAHILPDGWPDKPPLM
jgi:hypothetical protein